MDSNIASILKRTGAAEKEKNTDRSREEILIDRDLIENLCGPALIADESLNIIDKNIYAENLVAAFQDRNPVIHGIIIRCLTNNCPENRKITLDDETGSRHYDLFAFPIKSENENKTRVLLFGKDITVEQHLTKALVQSRQMFKDLVACSTDFAWETDNKGRFKYVSPNGILGYTAYELNDKKAADLILGQDGLNPFDTLDAINDVEIWLERSDASFACVQVSANPIIDNNSTWQGARGVCRDITEKKERESALRRIRKSEHVLRKIISTIRDEIDPSKILSTTANATLEGVTAKSCYITRIHRTDKNSYATELKAHSGEISDISLFDKVSKRAVSICENSNDENPPSFSEEIIDDQTVLIGISRHHNEINGAIYVLMDDERKSWNKDEKALFLGIVSHLGIALEQIKNYEELEKLSNTDELTSLFNRRAFVEKANKRLLIKKRKRNSCALLYIDVDNFKQINDGFGHAVGDRVLQKLAQILKKNIRTEDFCSRLGGDEFAVWLENVDEKSALSQANRILDCNDELKEVADDRNNPLSLSIGIAMSAPSSNDSLEKLMELADDALYKVKRNGKSHVVLNQTKENCAKVTE